jgi:hypothetical protein
VTPVRYEASEDRSDGPPLEEESADPTRRGAVVLVGTVAVLALFVVIFFIAGVHRNYQVTQLQDHGVRVDITVTGCLGVSSGSGSTPATWTCTGSFVLDGHRHNEVIGAVTTYYALGSHIRGVSVPSNPSLLSTVQAVKHEHPSMSVFVVPTIFSVVLLFFVAWLLRIRRRGFPVSTP